MFFADYHLHTNFSSDAAASPEEMVKAAVEKGLTEVTFTDHVDYDYPDDDSIFMIDYDKYFSVFEEIKSRYSDKIGIKIGVEIGLQEHIKDRIEDFIAKYPFDFIIGSSHCADRMNLMKPDFFAGRTKVQAYTRFFENELANAKIYENINVYGHLDYISRYGIYEDNRLFYSDFVEILDEILKVLIKTGRGIEINTSGYRYGMNTVYPQFEIIKRYRDLGGEVLTIGSDAHSTDYIADHFDTALNLAKEAGFEYLTSFAGRKPEFKKI